MTAAARTTNLFQAHDLVFFRVLKELQVSATGEFDDDSINAQIRKLSQAHEQIVTSYTRRGSFIQQDSSMKPRADSLNFRPSKRDWAKRYSRAPNCQRVSNVLPHKKI
jgi:hypothetical protein